MTFQGKDAWCNHPKCQSLTRKLFLGLLTDALVFGICSGAECQFLSKTTPQRVPKAVPFLPIGLEEFHH